MASPSTKNYMEKMTDKEVDELLIEGTSTGKISTVRKDGRPHVAPILFVWEHKKIYFLTMNTSIKAKNIANNPKVSFCTDDQSPPFSFVIIEGDAKIIHNANDLLGWAGKIGGRYMVKEASEEIIKQNQGMILIEITPSKIIGTKNIVQ